MKKNIILPLLFFVFSCLSFVIAQNKKNNDAVLFKIVKLLPENIADRILSKPQEFYADLKKVLDSEKDDILILVDKKHILANDYVPKNIINLDGLTGRKYYLNKKNIQLAAIAEPSLQKMAADAQKDGVKLAVSSAYRTYAYQDRLFNRYVRQSGVIEAQQFSAPPGASQHQLGTTIDFGSITNEFAVSAAGKWLYKNAFMYGWSLSFPKGYEKITGYRWESWHYRYIGVEACRFQKKWFDDIQQYMLEFIHNWKKL